MEKETVLPKNIRQIGDIQGKEKICIEDYVMTYIRKKEPQEEQGYLGIFLGGRRETEDAVYVFIRGILELSFESQDGEKENAQKNRLKETWERERAENFPGWDVQGCCIIGAYPTKKLELLSEIMPESGQMIYHLQEEEETLFWKESGQYQRIKGYFVFYEQNRKMQEYLAEVFRDDSVEKEGQPDRAIRSFREKVKEKNEKKTGSLLKLASSFFVVTVLIIGAIVVNRIDEIRNVPGTALSEQEALSAQTQQEGERLPAVDYFAKEQQDGTSDTGSTGDGQNAAADTEGAQSTVSTDTSGTDTGQDTADTAGAENQQTGILADRTASQEATANMTSQAAAADTTGQQAATDTANQEGQQTEAQASGTAGLQNPSGDGASESEAGEAVSRVIRASYVIKAGDTLANICSKYYGSTEKMEEICAANHIEDANMIMPGQKIVLP